MTPEEERVLMEGIARHFIATGDMLIGALPEADGLMVIMSMGLAATRMLHRAAPTPAMAMKGAEIFASSSLRAMADIVSGQDTETAGLQ